MHAFITIVNRHLKTNHAYSDAWGAIQSLKNHEYAQLSVLEEYVAFITNDAPSHKIVYHADFYNRIAAEITLFEKNPRRFEVENRVRLAFTTDRPANVSPWYRPVALNLYVLFADACTNEELKMWAPFWYNSLKNTRIKCRLASLKIKPAKLKVPTPSYRPEEGAPLPPPIFSRSDFSRSPSPTFITG